nr:MAG TPA: hypothetical protein [Caudoviricetes sp.]
MISLALCLLLILISLQIVAVMLKFTLLLEDGMTTGQMQQNPVCDCN